MPRLRGTESTQNIRLLGYKGIIIGVTGNALPEDVREFLNHGADGVISKPFDMDVFRAQIRNAKRRNSSC